MLTVEQRLRAIMKATGRRQQALAAHFDVSQSTIHRWLSGTEPEGPHRDSITELYDQVLGVHELENSEPASVKLVGTVGAGAEAHYYDETELGQVPAPEGATEDTVAVEIRGTSLGELFDHWLVYYDEVRSPVTPDMIGRLCVVGTIDGKVLVKKIQRAKTPGLYHLLSNTEAPILDAEVVWAAKVKSMVPR
ncbi:MAG: helix-turn-helix transcriptional regulator [Mesorhizobium sp.]|uniref:helix-turn-helix domain-containing protein n=1 Tax=Mesorhizobium sp. TaxID=1871066 RepID=UPI000FE84303|nr:helix-turn-helix transcriptional regulator [Mesorhizobium sp.]RWF44264.1 MAG: helix-turn-helix transcriptional regulator [Mesorhizobium sp.]